MKYFRPMIGLIVSRKTAMPHSAWSPSHFRLRHTTNAATATAAREIQYRGSAYDSAHLG